MTHQPSEGVDASIDQLVRREGARLTAALVSYLGASNLALAEDVMQDAIISALQTWQLDDMPSQPGAWLRRVATNRAIDVLRKRQRDCEFDEQDFILVPENSQALDEHVIEDGELRLLFLACHDDLAPQDQVILALNLVANFTAAEISKLMLRPQATLAQRLVRLKKKLRSADTITTLPALPELRDRCDGVVRALYLMFCAGYMPAQGDQVIRRDLMAEALRLAELLQDKYPTRTEISALCALFCFQASRINAREDNGQLIPLNQQDRAEWDREMIARGFAYLQLSTTGDELSRFHVEAAIAGEHAVVDDAVEPNWTRIQQLYAILEEMTGSPIVAVSAALVTLRAGNVEGAQVGLASISEHAAIKSYPPYYAVLAEVLAESGDQQGAAHAQERATLEQENIAVRAFLDERYASLLSS